MSEQKKENLIMPSDEELQEKYRKILKNMTRVEQVGLVKSIIKVQGCISAIARMLEEANFNRLESCLFWGTMDNFKWQEARSFHCKTSHDELDNLEVIQVTPDKAKTVLKRLFDARSKKN